MQCAYKLGTPALVLVSLFTCAASAQVGPEKTSTFHIQGTIRIRPWVAPGTAVTERKRIMKAYDGSAIQVTFESGTFSSTVIANTAGFYEADLPLGNYVIKVHNWHLCKSCKHVPGRAIPEEVYERPLFRVASPLNLVFNFALPSVFSSRSFLLPSSDGTPFTLKVRFGDYSRGFTGTYWFNAVSWEEELVCAEYNLFSLCADHIVYHKKQKTIEARRNVVFDNGLGKQEQWDAMFFKIDNGALIPLQAH